MQWKRVKIKERKVRHIGHDNVAPAWTKLAKGITCRNHGKDLTQLLPAAPAAPAGTDRRVRMASEWEIELRCRVWSRMGGRIGE